MWVYTQGLFFPWIVSHLSHYDIDNSQLLQYSGKKHGHGKFTDSETGNERREVTRVSSRR